MKQSEYPEITTPQSTDMVTGYRPGGPAKANRWSLATIGALARALFTATPATIAEGGTGSATAENARTALGVPSTAEAANDATTKANAAQAAAISVAATDATNKVAAEAVLRDNADNALANGLSAEITARVNGDAASVSTAAADAASKANTAQSAAIAAAASDATTKANAAQAAAIAASIPLAQKAAANGVASLDADTKLPAAQLPDAIDARIQVLSGTDAALATEVLALGEIAAPTDGAWLRRGNGVTPGGTKIGDLAALNATNLTSGTVNEARMAVTSSSTTVPGFRREFIGSGTLTGAYHVDYICTASSSSTVTFTDPAAEVSHGYYSFKAFRGSVVFGGVTYPSQPVPIYRQYDLASEFWRTRALFVPVPATATSAGSVSSFAYDNDYLYICVALNTWRRVAIASW